MNGTTPAEGLLFTLLLTTNRAGKETMLLRVYTVCAADHTAARAGDDLHTAFPPAPLASALSARVEFSVSICFTRLTAGPSVDTHFAPAFAFVAEPVVAELTARTILVPTRGAAALATLVADTLIEAKDAEGFLANVAKSHVVRV